MSNQNFTGNIFIFYAFDIGDDINFKAIEQAQAIIKKPYNAPKYFRNYHIPISIELPHPHDTSSCISAKLHHFGVLSLIYKVPFNSNIEELKKDVINIDHKYQEQSVSDASTIFKKIEKYINNPNFFHLRTNYPVIQVDHNKELTSQKLLDLYGNTIASLLRFETQNLSQNQIQSMLSSAKEYYRGDLVIIDTEAAFIYDQDYEELLEIFEFATIQQVELQYFDQLLNKKLNNAYDTSLKKLPWSTFIPFANSTSNALLDLGKIRVDISVITERLENSIKLTGDAYFSDIYDLLVQKLDLDDWKISVANKLEIIQDVRSIYLNQIDSIRENLMNFLIIILIFIELIVGILHYISS